LSHEDSRFDRIFQTSRSVTKDRLTLGALGGPQTFNAKAALLILERYPEFCEIIYFPTSEETMAAAMRNEVDAACGQEQTSKEGFHTGMQARVSAPGSPLHVIAETTQHYHCSLLGKPGAKLEMVRQVFGHTGSIAHSRHWLEANLPNATIDTVGTNSLGAAQSVLDDDGSTASVGSPDMAIEYGLTEMVKEIDDGSVVNYWAVSLAPRFSESPDRVVVAARFREKSGMSDLISTMASTGFALQAVYPRSSGAALYEYDYVFRFRGAGSLESVRAVLARCSAARLAGAWQSRE